MAYIDISTYLLNISPHLIWRPQYQPEMQSRDDMVNNLREKYHYVFFARDVPDMGYQPEGEIMAS